MTSELEERLCVALERLSEAMERAHPDPKKKARLDAEEHDKVKSPPHSGGGVKTA